ncbi:MAG TPA: zinc-ribbon domain containing protein [Elusimicrobiota bacterium]|jgi:transposase-like protein|nr:zinc-ribbon domain containing protein [Elusimicrobiota bacterium]HMZ26945.1 zinc-ribbon domain containing protein [Elusimicrobiota bacterium]HND64678.1 zinc-ribbon domain containing protein [Elusimicrobiota bacterium]HNG44833.1 zinc-ribbon domain containing protein [Elusimicrobiota bacterium]HNI56753.1 zinc-ribbon domain containing protein [Elusimicrobiota bacterium]
MGFIGFLKKLLGMTNAGDQRLLCAECGGNFVFEAGEQAFFAERGLTPPKRCPDCRKKNRGRRRFGRGRGR